MSPRAKSAEPKPRKGPHPSHAIRFSSASTFDFVCDLCGHTDRVPGGWGKLVDPCPGPEGVEPAPPLVVSGIGRDGQNPKAFVLYFNRSYTDDEMRKIHFACADGIKQALS